jgi:hypothetical protein
MVRVGDILRLTQLNLRCKGNMHYFILKVKA